MSQELGVNERNTVIFLHSQHAFIRLQSLGGSEFQSSIMVDISAEIMQIALELLFYFVLIRGTDSILFALIMGKLREESITGEKYILHGVK